MGGHFWFNGWSSVERIVAIGCIAFFLVLFLIRVYGNRTISKMNPSDFVMTVAIGSIIANWVLQSPISFVDGVAGVTVMLTLQIGSEWLTTRSKKMRELFEGRAVLVVYDGEMLFDVMKHENINDKEILVALREHGISHLRDVHAVVLEIDGSFSVLRREDGGAADTLHGVDDPRHRLGEREQEAGGAAARAT